MATDPFASVQPQIRQLPDRRILYVVGTTADFPTFPDACRYAVNTLFGYVAEHQIEYLPHTFSGICPVGQESGGMPAYYQAAVHLREGATPPTTESVQLGTLAGGRELVGIHTGPYSTLTESWALLNDYRDSLGEPVRDGIIYDLYIDDPRDVSEAEMRTELHIPLVQET